MPNTDKKKQTPWKENQIESTRPNIPRTVSVLSGYIACSMNAGHNKTITYHPVMAGQFVKEKKERLKIKMLTPLTPPYQDLLMTVRAYFVPNKRVWKNYEKFIAQKGGTEITKITEIPNMGGKKIPIIKNATGDGWTMLSNTTFWRDSWLSAYIPRQGTFKEHETEERAYELSFDTLPKASILPLRGRRAIFNEYERNREFTAEIKEYDGDTVSITEWNNYMTTGSSEQGEENEEIFVFGRAKKMNSYYTDWRTSAQGIQNTLPEIGSTMGNNVEEEYNTYSTANIYTTWAAWESKINEYRQQAENAQKQDREIIAEIRGSKLLTEGRVQLIGQNTFRLNYSAITQTSYNTNEIINEKFQVMGQQGAFSYTEVEVPVYAGMQFDEDGYVHIIATVQAETVFETGWNRQLLNVTPESQYRPDLKDDKFDIIYDIEMSTEYQVYESEKVEALIQAAGYKRKYSEYFTLPNVIQGDMTSNNYYQMNTNMYADNSEYDSGWEVETQKTYQFFETGFNYAIVDGNILEKHIWLDYSDIAVNKNLAIPNRVEPINTNDGYHEIIVCGENQIFMVGKSYMTTELPIDEDIKHNYTQWGEH